MLTKLAVLISTSIEKFIKGIWFLALHKYIGFAALQVKNYL